MMHTYKVAIRHACSCGKTATYEVFNARNVSMGFYCSRCAYIQTIAPTNPLLAKDLRQWLDTIQADLG